jgi:hypothetical protein
VEMEEGHGIEGYNSEYWKNIVNTGKKKVMRCQVSRGKMGIKKTSM